MSKRTVFVAIEANETETPGLLYHQRIGNEELVKMLTLTHEHSGRAIAHFWNKEKLLECAKRLNKINWDRGIDEVMSNPTGDGSKTWKSILAGIENLVREMDGQKP